MAAAKGVVSAGNPDTVRAGCIALENGGNAFDAARAALSMACVAEPVRASLAGGGFLTAWPADAAPRVYDFLVRTPRAKRPAEEVDFYPLLADFGAATRQFHVGMGAGDPRRGGVSAFA